MTEPVYGDARVVQALATLRSRAEAISTYIHPTDAELDMQKAFALLDQAGIFAAIDRTTGVNVAGPRRRRKLGHREEAPTPTFCACGNYTCPHPFPGCEAGDGSEVVAAFPIGPDGETGQFHADGSYSELPQEHNP